MTQDNSIVIREYLTTDKEVVMNLIKLNTPNFFAKEEVNDLSNYLDKEIELYYVLLVDGKVVGCGGINFAEKRTIGKISYIHTFVFLRYIYLLPSLVWPYSQNYTFSLLILYSYQVFQSSVWLLPQNIQRIT